MSNTTTLSQDIEQRLRQTANAAQVMLSKIIEMPLNDLEDHVKNELESNQALERSAGDENFSYGNDANDAPGDYSVNDDFRIRNSHTSEEEYGDFLTIDQVPEDMRTRYNNDVSHGFSARQFNDDDKPAMEISDEGATSYDSLVQQIGELQINDDERVALTYIVGSLDERGYLTKSDETLIDELAFQEYIDLTPEELHRLIGMLQGFEPRGIGAHTLQECMMLQLSDPEDRAQHSKTLTHRLALKVVRDCFDNLSKSRWDKIQEELDVNDEAIHDIKALIRRLNPMPGKGLNESMAHTAPTITPDFYLFYEPKTGNTTISLEKGNVPQLKVSTSYLRIVEEHDSAVERAKAEGRQISFSRQQQADYEYAVHKVDAAKAFIENIRRRNATLMKVMEGIAKFQHDFFAEDDDESLLKPLKQQVIAEYAGVDISTVSRAVNAKYVRTDYGTYPLKHFFSSEFVSASGETVAQRQAVNAVRRIIEGEDSNAPFSDQAISDLLKQEGMNVARRTVAKYRERLGFPIAQHRKGH